MRQTTHGPRSPGPLRVLVVDDCPDTTTTLSILLRIWGHDSRVAADGRTALEVAHTYRPHVVVLDLGLPGGTNGLCVARQLRADSSLQPIVLVVLSGYATDADRRETLLAGADHHFAKPIEPEELQRLLATVTALFPDQGSCADENGQQVGASQTLQPTPQSATRQLTR
jgi:CheY-like chemotaxis protein